MAIFDKLFELIKSLTKQEKIYFKTYAKGSKSSAKKYIQLFDAIANQNEYNEQKIRQQFKDEQFIKQLPVAKDYLYKMIMKALRNFDNFDPLIHIVLQKMLHDINILYDKALYHSCEKVIYKAKKIAEENEQFLYLSYVLDWERKILLSHGESLEKRKKIQTILTAQTTALEKEKNTILFRDLFDNLSTIAINNLSVRNKEKRQTLNELMRHPLLANIDMAMGFLSKLNFYNIHHLYNKLLRNRSQSIIYSSKAVLLFELKEHKELLTEYKEQYCNALLNLCIDQAWMGKEEEFKVTHQKFNVFTDQYPELKTVVFPRIYIAQALLFDRLGKYNEVQLLADNFEKEFTQFRGEISKERLMLVYYNFSCLYIARQDYKEALRWLNKVLNDTTKELLKDVYCTSRILNLIIHYELGNTDLLESLTRSTYRYLLQQQNLYKFETTIINFIRVKLPKVNSHEKLIETFKELKKDLIILSKDDYEKPILDTFDFIPWLESKIENRSFTETVKERANTNR